MDTIIVNLYGGPGSGKSTTCAGVFERLKLKGINCEMATEYAKDKVWEESFKTLDDQIYVFGKQLHKINRLLGKVEVIITDSPLLFSIVYDKEKNEKFKELVIDQYKRMDNWDYYIRRDNHFEQAGRMQNLQESKQLDRLIFDILNECGGRPGVVDKVAEDGTIAADVIATQIMDYLSRKKQGKI